MAVLISKGHLNVLGYGYTFFKVCLKTVEKEFKMQILAGSASIAMAFGGKESAKMLE